MTRELAGGLWNAQRDRDPELVRRYARQMSRQYALDFLLLQEFAGYVDHLLAWPIEGWRLLVGEGTGYAGDQNLILVRDDVDVRRVRDVQLTEAGWYTVDGRDHAPVRSTVAVLDGWLRVASVHAPVSVAWDVDGRPVGPELRVNAYRDHQRRLLQLVRRGRRKRPEVRTLLGGDWNARTWERGAWTPHALAALAGLDVVEPANRRGPGHDGIDYVLTDATVPCLVKHAGAGSDHPFITFVVRP